MKKHLVTIAIILVFLAGLSVLLYPYVADYFNAQNQSRAVASYRDTVRNMSEEDRSDIWESAHEYNRALNTNMNRFMPSDEEHDFYNTLLNVTTAGIMGTLEIDLIGVNLAIYHGTTEGVLQVGLGHFEGTSLPVGGLGTHTVITGHRGLPSSTLLTNLDRMDIGDTFALHILGESLWYQVDRIMIVEPEDLSGLDFDPSMDYCTLITCTPYGINSHRMLVRGHRIDSPETVDRPATIVRSEAGRINRFIPLLIVVVPVAIVLLGFQFTRILIRFVKARRKT